MSEHHTIAGRDFLETEIEQLRAENEKLKAVHVITLPPASPKLNLIITNESSHRIEIRTTSEEVIESTPLPEIKVGDTIKYYKAYKKEIIVGLIVHLKL